MIWRVVWISNKNNKENINNMNRINEYLFQLGLYDLIMRIH